MNVFELFDQYCGMPDRKERLQFACANPELISSKLLPHIEARLDGETGDGTATRRERLAELDAFRQFIARDASRYPAGVGPVERLAARVIQREISLETATQEVRQPEFIAHLAPLYVSVVIWHAERLVREGQMGTAVLWARLLAESCRAAFPEDPPHPLLEDAAMGWIQVAGMALGSIPDGEIHAAATAFGQQLLARLNRPEDLPRQANILHALGVLHSDPITSTTGSGVRENSRRQWLQKLEVEKGAALARRYLQQYPLPEVEESLKTAIGYFERARPNRSGVGRGITTKALAQTLVFLAHYRKEAVDLDRVKPLLEEALSLLEPGSYQHTGATRILRSLGLTTTAAAPTFDAANPDEVLQQAGVVEDSNPSDALSLLIQAEELFAQMGSETQRTARLVLMLRLVIATNGGAAAGRFAGPLAAVLEDLLKTARTEKWTVNQLGAVMLDLARRSGRTNEEGVALQWLQSVTQKCPELAAHQGPLALLLSDLSIGAAVNEVNADDPVTAVQLYGQALAPSLRLGLPSRALEVLQRIADLASRPHEDMALTVMCALAPVVFEIERGLGTAGIESLQSAYQNLFAGFGEEVNSAITGMLLQLAKGLRFSTTLRQVPGVDWRQDPAALELCRQIESLQAEADQITPSTALDEILLVSSVSDIKPIGGTAATERLTNLRREFDRHVNDLLCQRSRGGAILKPEIIQQLLGPRTVLLDYFFASDGENRHAVHTMIYTAEEMLGARNPIVGKVERNLMEAGNVQAVVDFIGMRVLRLREALQLDPGTETLHPNARTALAEDFKLLLGKSTWNYLEKLRQEGKDHLCIRPHGAMRYYPLHLLGPGDEDLARHWIVTTIPSLECLLPKPFTRRGLAGEALGLTYAGGKPFPLVELDSASAEVEAIAKILGTKPVLDEAVTEERCRQALSTARRVHLCAHGAHDAAAPLFQRLFVTPSGSSDGRVCAYEILGHDLRGLEVVTLGSCDSALGRFDAGDNLSGLPAALLAAGAQTIVASLWDMLDPAALEFFRTFYQELQQEKPRLDAFRTAQLAVRTAYPQARDWGAFCYLGAWHTGDAPSPSDMELYIALE